MIPMDKNLTAVAKARLLDHLAEVRPEQKHAALMGFVTGYCVGLRAAAALAAGETAVGGMHDFMDQIGGDL
jgi:hypothetical protein